MTDANLKIRVDTREVDKGAKSLNDLATSGGKAEKSTKALTSATDTLTRAAKTAAGALALTFSTREIIQYADAWTNAENKLKIVTNTARDLASVQGQLLSVANDSRSAFASTATLYSRLALSTTELNLSQSRLVNLTSTITKSFALNGATAAEASGAITQLSQGLAAGALRGQEYNSVLEQAPGIARAIASSLGLTLGELRAFANEGKITAEIVVNALEQASGKIESDFSEATATFGQSMQIARNNMIEFVGSSDLTQGAVSGAGDAVVLLSESMDDLAYIAGITAAVMAIKLAPSIAANSTALTYGSAQLVAYQLRLASMAGVAGKARAAQVAMTISTGALSTAMSALGGPIGILTIALGGLHLAYQSVVDIQKEAREGALDWIEETGGIESLDLMLVSLTGQLTKQAGVLAKTRESMANFGATHVDVQREEEKLLALVGEFNETSERRIELQVKVNEINETGTAGTVRYTGAVQDLNETLVPLSLNTLNANIQLLDMEAVMRSMRTGHVPGLDSTFQDLNDRIQNSEFRMIGVSDAAQDTIKTMDDLTESIDYQSQMLENVQREWGNLIYDLFSKENAADIGDFFDTIAKGFARMISEMAAADLANAVFGSGGLGSIASGASSGGGLSALTSGSVASLISGGSQFLGGLTGTAVGTGSAIVGPPTAAAAAGSNLMGSMAGFLTSPAGIAAGVLIAGKVIHDMTSNPDGYTRSNAGLLTAPTPGAKSKYTFGVDAFDSGFAPTGVARREDRKTAEEYIESLRSLDSTVVSLVKQLDGSISVGTLNGLNQEATPGSRGTYLGSGRDADIGQQVNSFVTQLADHITGLDGALLESIQSATTAEQVIGLLTEAVAEQEGTTKDLAEEEKRLEKARAESMRSLNTMFNDFLRTSESANKLKRTLQSDIYRILGVSEMRPSLGGETAEQQLASVAALRDFLINDYEDELSMERQLHAERVQNYEDQLALSKSIGSTINSILLGDNSNLSTSAKFELAMKEFNRLAGMAEGGDLGAAREVGSAGETAIRSIRDMFATGGSSKELTQTVIDRLLGIQGQYGSATNPGAFSPSQDTEMLVGQLQGLQGYLSRIQSTLASQAIGELEKLNLSVKELPAQLAALFSSLLGSINTGNHGNQQVPFYGIDTGPIPVGTPIPSGYANGGIASGPSSGYMEMLHGTEAVVPLPNGRSIPVQMQNGELLEEIRELKKAVIELKGVEMAGHQYQGNQSAKTNQILENVEQKLGRNDGVGSANYADVA